MLHYSNLKLTEPDFGPVTEVARSHKITPVNGTSAEVNGSPDGDEASCALDPLNPTKAYAIYKHQNGNVYSKIDF